MSAARRREMERFRFNGWGGEAVQVAVATAPPERLLRSSTGALRDAMVVYGYQILLRFWLLAKRWNY
jgi:hypothetical protein